MYQALLAAPSDDDLRDRRAFLRVYEWMLGPGLEEAILSSSGLDNPRQPVQDDDLMDYDEPVDLDGRPLPDGTDA